MPSFDSVRAVWSLLVHSPVTSRVSEPHGSAETLEARLMLTTIAEVEANNSFGTAQQVTIAEGDIVTTTEDDWTIIDAAMNPFNDLDFFEFTLTQDAGVFFDVDILSTNFNPPQISLNIFDAGQTQINNNSSTQPNDTFFGKDFFSRDATTQAFKDEFDDGEPAWYLDLDAGTYFIEIDGNGFVGDYNLKLFSDTTYSATQPSWESLPGSADTLYLDFNGANSTETGADWGNWNATAFDMDGDASTFSPEERFIIYEAWRVVAEDYSPFDINVMVGDPGTIGNGVGYHMVITNNLPSTITGDVNDDDTGNGGVAGIAFLDVYGPADKEANTGFVFNSTLDNGTERMDELTRLPVTMANVITHEFGHGLGLEHYDAFNNDQTPGPTFGDTIDNVIMNFDAARGQSLWSIGTTDEGDPQDDVAIIASARNTFGFRDDDHGNTIGAATNVSGGLDDGVIEQLSDADAFRFNASGDTTITVDVDEYINNLDAKLTIFDSTGQQIGQSDPGGSFDATVTLNGLAAGTYFAIVESNGETGEIGQYEVRIDTESTNDNFDDIIGMNEFGHWIAAQSDGTSFQNSFPGTQWNPAAGFTDAVIGDFNGDGFDDLAGRNSSGFWLVSLSDGTNYTNEFWGKWTSSGDWLDVRAGDFNGDGRTDIAGRRANGNWFVALSDGTKFITTFFGKWGTAAFTDVLVGDYNGDGKDDIAGRNPTNHILVSLGNAAGDGFDTSFFKQWASGAWEHVRVGDFNDDGRDDLASFRAGNWWIWESTGTTFIADFYGKSPTNQPFIDVLVGDFDNDGRADIAVRIEAGHWFVGLSNGDSFAQSLFTRWASGDANVWEDVQAGDFNGDGLTDIAGRRNGNWWVAISTGTSFTTSLFGNWPTARTWTNVMNGRVLS